MKDILTYIGALIVIVTGVMYSAAYTSCSNIHRLTGLETDFTLSLGCMVKYRGEWVVKEVVTEHKQDVMVKP